MDDDPAHYRFVAAQIRKGMVVPFLGAGANLAGRKEGDTFRQGEILPDGRELAQLISKAFQLATEDGSGGEDLLRVSQHAAVIGGPGELYDRLHEIFDDDYAPNELHTFLAQIPELLESKPDPSYPLIVTTNYDDALEKAFDEAEKEFDLIVYIADGEEKGKCVHIDPTGKTTVVTVPNEYDGVSLKDRSVIMKIHGAVRRQRDDSDDDSYVITEDHYIDYLTRTDLSNLIPFALHEKLKRSHLLFLGYSLRDWNLRAILHRIQGEKMRKRTWWAVQLHPDVIDQKSWASRNVDILDMDLAEYVSDLRSALEQPETDDAKVTS